MNYSLSHLPARPAKPREDGLTMVMDKGLGLRQAEDLIEASGHLIDLVKLGFGSSYVTPNLKARASYSTSYLRPDLLQLVPAVAVNPVNQTVTIGNPDLRPEMAETIDLKLEYYTKNNGIASVTVFRRWNKDRITTQSIRGGDLVENTPDNGFDGLYGGYAILAPRNNGTAVFDGLEFDFRQRLSFLPGFWRGLTTRGNVSLLKAEQRVITQFTAAGDVLNTYKACG